MIVIGEKLNTSNRRIARAVVERDAAFIIAAAREQAEAGADYIDVNAGTLMEEEAQSLCWLVGTIQAEVDRPLCLDSADPMVLARAAECHRGEAMINSISLDAERLQGLLPLITSWPCRVVALCMPISGLPASAGDRVEAGAELAGRLTDAGVAPEKIYLDPLVQPVSVDAQAGVKILESLEGIRRRLPGVNIICGLSNISFGLPRRRLLNRSFLALCLSRGLDAAILDPTDERLMDMLLSTETLMGRDENCQSFIDAHLSGRFETEE
jgi:5-methyltetrahydrofolate--homocysteine methyltransferase